MCVCVGGGGGGSHRNLQSQVRNVHFVHVCVCDGCGRGRNKFAGRVQNRHVGFQLVPFLEIVKSAAGLDTLRCRLTQRIPLWALVIALATGKNTRLFGLLDQNETRFFTYVSQRAESKAATVATRN